MVRTLAAWTTPSNVKNFTTAFLILALLMVAAQAINFIVTLLPAAQEAIIDLGDGTTTTVAPPSVAAPVTRVRSLLAPDISTM